MLFSNQLVTVWSAPDYCYRMRNVAAVLEVDDSLNMFFNTFYKSPFRERLQESAPLVNGTGGITPDGRDDPTKGSDPNDIDNYYIAPTSGT